MTQSGPRESAAEFVASLARNPNLSQRAILARARASGFRIANQVGRGIISLVRENEATASQRGALLRFRDTSAVIERLRQRATQIINRRLQRAVVDRQVRITYEVTALVGFLWGGSREDGRATQTRVEREVTIRYDQQESFRANLPVLARTHARTLGDRGARRLGVNPQYGDVVLLEEPVARVTNVRLLGS